MCCLLNAAPKSWYSTGTRERSGLYWAWSEPLCLGGESRAKAVGMTEYAPAHESPGQPIILGGRVVASQPRSPEKPRGRGRRDKEQPDLLLMAPGNDEFDGLGLVRDLCQDPSLFSTGVQAGVQACMAKSWLIKLSSSPESRNDAEMDSWP